VELAARSTFYAICALHGGLEITRKAEVRGFLYDEPWGCSGDCEDMLGRNTFEFVEREITESEDFAFPKERGKYRFFLASRGSPECAAYEEQLRKYPGNRGRYFSADRCLGVIPVSAFESDYVYSRFRDESKPYQSTFKIWRRVSKITDLRNKEVLAQATSFALLGGIVLDPTGDAPACYDKTHLALPIDALTPAASGHKPSKGRWARHARMSQTSVLEEIEGYRQHFDAIYVGGIPHLLNDDGAFLAFLAVLTATDALAGLLAPTKPTGERFRSFIATYYPEDHRPHADQLWEFRNAMVH
jgi:hypothetical protein